jgi:RNA polymerase sigma factor (TIGR02999 family)
MPVSGEVTQLLVAYREGDRDAFERLVPIVYDDLRRIARAHLRRNRAGHTLNTTVLVHEAYLRLVDQTRAQWEDRQHFLSVCARAMRQIIISNARKHAAAKRGGGERRVTLDEGRIAGNENAEWLLSLDRALERLAARNERLARVVECRYFAGLSERETADALQTSLRTVQRDWMRARAWLREDLGAGPGEDDTES